MGRLQSTLYTFIIACIVLLPILVVSEFSVSSTVITGILVLGAIRTYTILWSVRLRLLGEEKQPEKWGSNQSTNSEEQQRNQDSIIQTVQAEPTTKTVQSPELKPVGTLRPPYGVTRQEYRAWYSGVYLQSSYWYMVRQLVRQRDGNECQYPNCYCRRHLEVHHMTYERLGCEWQTDLILLCNVHHRQISLVEEDEQNRLHSYFKKGIIARCGGHTDVSTQKQRPA